MLAAALPELEARALVTIETNLDDMNPQLFGPASEALFAAGARDVWVTPIQMKKGRPAHTLSVLADAPPAPAAAAVTRVMLEHTTALGVRVTPVTRMALHRRHITVRTVGGSDVRVKLGTWGAGEAAAIANAHPEVSERGTGEGGAV